MPHGTDEHVFKVTQVTVQVTAFIQADDRVADDLTGPMVGDVAAAIGFDDFDPLRREDLLIPDKVIGRAWSDPDRINRFVFGEDKRVRKIALTPLPDELQLPVPCRLVCGRPPVNSMLHPFSFPDESAFVESGEAVLWPPSLPEAGFRGMGYRMRIALWGLACVSLLFLNGCGGGTFSDNPASPLKVGIGGEPRDLDPHTVSGIPEVTVILSLMEGLLAYHPTDDTLPYPGIAERWEQSEDGRTWRFFLRSNARWSNGDPVTASDFVYSWRRVLHPDLGNEYVDWLYMIEGAEAWNRGRLDSFSKVGIKAESDLVFTVVLKEPVADFLKILLNHSFLPVHRPTIEAHGGPGVRQSGWTRPEHYVSNGPYRLVKWIPNSVIRVERNPHYWDAASVRTDAFAFYPINDENTELRAFESGQLHVTNSVPVNLRQHYRQTQPEKIRFDPYAGVYYLRLNTTRPPLDDPRVRRALSLSIDRGQIINNLLKGGERVATGMVPAGLGGYQPPDRETYNPDRARMLLAEAGFPGGEGFPVRELLFNTSDNHRKIAEAIQHMWRRELGIDITLTNKEWMVYLNTSQSMQYDIARAGWIGNLYPYSFLRTLHSFSPNNETGYDDPYFDELLLRSTHTLDQAARHELIYQAEKRMLEAEPIIPLYWYTNVFLIDPRVRNWSPKLVNQRPLKFVYLED